MYHKSNIKYCHNYRIIEALFKFPSSFHQFQLQPRTFHIITIKFSILLLLKLFHFLELQQEIFGITDETYRLIRICMFIRYFSSPCHHLCFIHRICQRSCFKLAILQNNLLTLNKPNLLDPWKFLHMTHLAHFNFSWSAFYFRSFQLYIQIFQISYKYFNTIQIYEKIPIKQLML